MQNLNPINYISPEIHAQDVARIFSASWQLIGAAERLAQRGDYIATEIAGNKVFVVRTRSGLRAFRNVCRHRGARLLPEGSGRCSTIRCPYHQWVWGEDGSLLNVPWWGDDADFRMEDWALEEISLHVWRGLLFVALAPSGPFEAQLGALADEIADEPVESYRWMREERLVFDANWKLYTDNFVEGYHIPGIHPEFHRAIEFERFETVALEGMVRMSAPPRPGLFYRGKWMWMWPNWTLSLFAGGINTSRINPIDHRRTELIYNFYFEDTSEEGAAARDKIVEDNLAVVREDFEVCLETQKNYESGGYRAGPLSPRHEQGVAYFQELLRGVGAQ
ncbi:aromatic ring-hydroxylating dioxygenase subunit alpha [Oceanicella sp. SM1341]|uniref:aromatic ring-hydroxylating oxygenase subunit alpha n=1 Tax=Oceanicella sp. SM1341 TaxID=1548889 RepID=UPI0018E55DED|nr:aromatic ring-hydroxylating dioxygenase subunit alpha [Oceanicella sp. SM1341]